MVTCEAAATVTATVAEKEAVRLGDAELRAPPTGVAGVAAATGLAGANQTKTDETMRNRWRGKEFAGTLAVEATPEGLRAGAGVLVNVVGLLL